MCARVTFSIMRSACGALAMCGRACIALFVRWVSAFWLVATDLSDGSYNWASKQVTIANTRHSSIVVVVGTNTLITSILVERNKHAMAISKAAHSASFLPARVSSLAGGIVAS
jgi:hypothetical protein